jgi:DNA-binding response OmpR family regulator
MEAMSARVLVVDDEPMVRDVLTRYLEQAGYEVRTAGDGQEALDEFVARTPDIVLLDLMLPRVDGLDVFKRMRSAAGTPVIMLTARGEETDRVVGLEIGADDYITKPFSPREVLARTRAVLRRAGIGRAEPDGVEIVHGDLRIDPRRREVSLRGDLLHFTRKEFDLLATLAAAPGTVFTRTRLLEDVWDFAWGDPSTVTVHVRRIREKIEPDPSTPRHLVTVWGVGYRFDP